MNLKAELSRGLAGTFGATFLFLRWGHSRYYGETTTQPVDEYSVPAKILPRYAKTSILGVAGINVCLLLFFPYAVYI